jgi:succinate dehydrogenase/fumarate reductase flavoprotein subunit
LERAVNEQLTQVAELEELNHRGRVAFEKALEEIMTNLQAEHAAEIQAQKVDHERAMNTVIQQVKAEMRMAHDLEIEQLEDALQNRTTTLMSAVEQTQAQTENMKQIHATQLQHLQESSEELFRNHQKNKLNTWRPSFKRQMAKLHL